MNTPTPGEREARLHASYAAVRARLMGRRVVSVRPAPPPPEIILPNPEVPVSLVGRSDWHVLLRLVALKHGIGPSDILGRDRRFSIVAARRELAKLISTHMQLSLPQVGRLLHRDHTTILNLIRPRAERC